MYTIKIDEKNQKIFNVKEKKYFPRSISSIIGTVVKNNGLEIILKEIRFGVVIDKKTLKIRFADAKMNELTIKLNEKNLMNYQKGNKIRLDFSILKLIDVGSNNYEKTFKDVFFKHSKYKEKK